MKIDVEFARVEIDGVEGAATVQRRRSGIEKQRGRPRSLVEAGVAQDDGGVGDLRVVKDAATGAVKAAHLEEVGEIRLEFHRDLDAAGPIVEVADVDPFEAPRFP